MRYGSPVSSWALSRVQLRRQLHLRRRLPVRQQLFVLF